MKILDAILQSNRNDCITTVSRLLKTNKVKFTNKELENLMLGHSDYPSLLAVKDVLENYGIKSVAINKGNHDYSDFELPFISLIQQENWSTPAFSLVVNIKDGNILFSDPPSGKYKSISILDFEKLDKGVILLIDSKETKHEKDYEANKKEELKRKMFLLFPYFTFFVILAISLFYQIFFTHSNWISVLFTTTSAVGLIISSVLIWHEIDSYNPFLKEVCGGIKGKKINCEAVLSSNGAKLLNISWSLWGASYFYTFFLSQFLFVKNDDMTQIWLVNSFLVSPYIIYSLYYQGIKIRRWCPMCLGILMILSINLIASITYLILGNTIAVMSWYNIIIIVLLGIVILGSLGLLIPLLKSASDSKNYERKWKKLKYHPDTFNSLLKKSEKLIFPPQDLGIVIGNLKSENEIVKVCNPYCDPCSKAHPELEALIKNNPDVRLRIIFTATGKDNDFKTPPVRHLMALHDLNDPTVINQALNDWYTAKEKNYDQFALKYPLGDELNKQTEKIIAMDKWCDLMRIRATPTFYINGFELPDSYNVSELKYVL
ncbi:vitamin K epoxide reductase family protein [Sphingobacterium multivorum]|uniref:vitamin K epoxide reductase family protein n=1 Tax=Sphingobacterium multivorum TaxID=28454 RepID=UPI0028AE7160|nr:vitamin K epoxide reductase family protein [Sphingobacterium multivorum]